MRRFGAWFGLGMMAIVTGCTTPPTETAAGSTQSRANTTSDNMFDSAVFDPAQVQPGDRVLGLEVTRMDISRLEPQNQSVGTVNFQGETTVSGVYFAYTPADLNESFPCFNVDESAADQLPRFPQDERRPWFCFDNPEAVQQALGEPANQPATIVIDHFEYAYIPADVTNRARFVRVAE